MAWSRFKGSLSASALHVNTWASLDYVACECVGCECGLEKPTKMNINRGSVWSDVEVKALISIWGEAKVQEQLDSSTRNKS